MQNSKYFLNFKNIYKFKFKKKKFLILGKKKKLIKNR